MLQKIPKNSASKTEEVGGVPPEEATERPQTPTFLLTLSVPLRLYNVSNSSACHSLISSFTSVRGLGPSSSPTFQFSHRPYHVMSLSNQRRASSARCARVAGVQDFLRALGILKLARKVGLPRSSCLSRSSDAAALVRALGLKQRVFARPLGGRLLGHLSRKAGSSAHGGLFQKPSEGR